MTRWQKTMWNVNLEPLLEKLSYWRYLVEDILCAGRIFNEVRILENPTFFTELILSKMVEQVDITPVSAEALAVGILGVPLYYYVCL